MTKIRQIAVGWIFEPCWGCDGKVIYTASIQALRRTACIDQRIACLYLMRASKSSILMPTSGLPPKPVPVFIASQCAFTASMSF